MTYPEAAPSPAVSKHAKSPLMFKVCTLAAAIPSGRQSRFAEDPAGNPATITFKAMAIEC
jgi:hypothetical protein